MAECFVCPVTLKDLMTVVGTEDADVAWNIAMSHGLTKRTAICSQCHSVLYLNTCYKFRCYGAYWGMTEDLVVVPKKCITWIDGKSGTFFEHSGLSVAENLALIWYFLDFDLAVKDASLSLHVSRSTVLDLNRLFSEVLLHHCVHNSRQLGGPGKVVEVQWAMLGVLRHDKYHWPVKGQWILAGVESDSRESFVLSVDNNAKDILIPLIQLWIRPGTIIIYDCWKDLIKLREVGYTCFTKRCLKEKNLTITSSWMDFTCSFITRCRRRSFDSYVCEALFSFLWPDKSERFHQFLLAAAKVFPPNY